jgi:hypothetical protein
MATMRLRDMTTNLSPNLYPVPWCSGSIADFDCLPEWHTTSQSVGRQFESGRDLIGILFCTPLTQTSKPGHASAMAILAGCNMAAYSLRKTVQDTEPKVAKIACARAADEGASELKRAKRIASGSEQRKLATVVGSNPAGI